MQIRRFIKLTSAVLFSGLLLPRPVNAYLDPGTGSYIIQIIIGAFLGGGYLVKTYWREIKAKYNQMTKKESKNDDQITE
jgi:hypothetical protein